MSLLPSFETTFGADAGSNNDTDTTTTITTAAAAAAPATIIPAQPPPPPSSSQPVPAKRIALAPLPLDKHGLGSDGAAYLHGKGGVSRNSNNDKSSDRSSLVAGLFVNPLGVLEDSTHPSPQHPRLLNTSLDLNHSFQSSAVNRGAVPGAFMHGPTPSDFSALWKSNANVDSVANSSSVDPKINQTPASPSNSINPPPPTLPSPTTSLTQGGGGRSSPAPLNSSSAPSATISLPLLSPPVPAVSSPSPSIPNVSAAPSSIHSPIVSSTSTAPMLGLGAKSSVLPFVIASGMFDYGLGSMHASGAGVAHSVGGQPKSGMLPFPTNMFGGSTGNPTAPPAPPPPTSTNVHLPPASGTTAAAPQHPIADTQHQVPMNSMSAALVAAAAAQSWIPAQSMAMAAPASVPLGAISSTLPLGVPTSIAVHPNAVPPNLLVKQEAQSTTNTAPNASTWSQPSTVAANGSVVNVVAPRTAAVRQSRKRPRPAASNDDTDGMATRVGDELKEKCPLCPAKLRTRVILQNHLRVVHKSGSEHRCLECSAEFPWKSTLDNHVRLVHRRERPFKCTRCDKAFRWSSHLQEHTWVVHEKKKPFKCEICNKAFGRKNNMQKHARKVHGPR